MEKNKIGIEIEKKYIIEMPDISLLMKNGEYTVSQITQIYLPSEKGETRRIRRRKYQDRAEYTETRKIRIDKMSATEIEREITEKDFLELSCMPLENTSPIVKTRHTFRYMNQTFEIDVYPSWEKSCIMETELEDRESIVEFPDFINIIKEVTGDKAYTNASMSRHFPKEEI